MTMLNTDRPLDQEMIDQIVAKVVALVRTRLATAVPPQRVLLLFSGASTGYVAGMETIRLLTEANHNLTVIMTASALHVVGEDNVRQAGARHIVGPDEWVDTPGLVRKIDLLLVPTLSMSTSARLALGMMDSLFSTLILGALLNNKPVIAVCDGADPYGKGGLVFSDTFAGAPALRQKLSDYLGTLIEFGINLVPADGFVTAVINRLHGTAQADPDMPAAVPLLTENGRFPTILTAADLSTYTPGSHLHLPAATRLTALAQDIVRQRNLRLQFINK
ncbi:MAG: flavoprotein [Chloroflexota bacterium]